MALPGETLGSLMGKLGNGTVAVCTDCHAEMPLAVHQSAAGYYIGTWCPNCGPYSRESHYYRTRESAQADLESGDYPSRG